MQIVLKERMGAMMQSKDVNDETHGCDYFRFRSGPCADSSTNRFPFSRWITSKKPALKKKTAKCWRWARVWRIMLEDAGQPIDELLATPSSTAGITPLVQEIIMIIEEWHFHT
ncbi:MAG: hypothetical protein MZV70_25575 [Desulfobacterales bacterium]|nr:hypothetical protein [Desulfobacterales bacterium]